MDLRLADRNAAVAASSAGLGFAVAAALAAEGAQVAICGRDEARVREAAERIGPGARPFVADVATTQGATGFVEQATGALGQIDILVTNAGGPPPGTFATTTIDGYVDALWLNLLSTIAMCQVAVPPMRSRGWGRVVGIASMGARQPIPGMIASNTARAGTVAFLKTLATEVAPDGVTVNAVLPGSHATDRIRGMYGDDMSPAIRNVPVGRIGVPADFGSVVAFLSSEEAGFITGSAVSVEGGACGGLL